MDDHVKLHLPRTHSMRTLKPLSCAQTDEHAKLHLPGKAVPAVHVASIALHHKYCCCTVARTLMFNARKDQIEKYKILFEVRMYLRAVLLFWGVGFGLLFFFGKPQFWGWAMLCCRGTCLQCLSTSLAFYLFWMTCRRDACLRIRLSK